MEMNCEKVREMLPLHAGGEVEENERIAVDAHLPLCTECSQELQDYRQSRSMLSELREGTMPPGTDSAIWKAVREEVFPEKKRILTLDWAVRYAAVLVMGLAIGYVVMVYAKPKKETPADSVAKDADNSRTGPTLVSGDKEFARTPETADLIGSHSTRQRPFLFEFPDFQFSLPRASGGDGPYSLPQVERVLATSERSF